MTNKLASSIFVVVALVMTSACGKSSPIAPGGGSAPVVQPPVISVPANTIIKEGETATFTISTGPFVGSVAVALALIRDDGDAVIASCGAASGNGVGNSGQGATFTFAGESYLWAKGHIINGALLEAYFTDPQEAFRTHGCYFMGANQLPPVLFDRATKRTDIKLNWQVE